MQRHSREGAQAQAAMTGKCVMMRRHSDVQSQALPRNVAGSSGSHVQPWRSKDACVMSRCVMDVVAGMHA